MQKVGKICIIDKMFILLHANLLFMAEFNPLFEHLELIDQRHVVVFEHVQDLSYLVQPWVSTEFIIAICKKGWLKVRHDMHKTIFRQNDITMVYPDHAVVPGESSEDFDITLIVASHKWAKQEHLAFPIQNVMEHILHPEFHLTNEQMRSVDHCLEVIKDMSLIRDEAVRDELLKNQLDNFVRLLDYYRAADPSLSVDFLTNPKRIAYRFYQDLVENYKVSRETKFYADKQNLTPKYFGTTVYEVTGIHVSDWIARYIVTKAKMMLQSRDDLTVAEIGHSLGFETPSDFGRYFKRQTGTSPAAYRREFIEEL